MTIRLVLHCQHFFHNHFHFDIADENYEKLPTVLALLMEHKMDDFDFLIKLMLFALFPFFVALYFFYPDQFWHFISGVQFFAHNWVPRPTIIKPH